MSEKGPFLCGSFYGNNADKMAFLIFRLHYIVATLGIFTWKSYRSGGLGTSFHRSWAVCGHCLHIFNAETI